MIEAVDVAVPGEALMLKWPNDLLLNGAKLAGVLLERSGDRIIAGFGVNLAVAPDLPARPVASLAGAISLQAFAPLLAGSFDRLLGIWRSTAPEAFARAWLARAHPIGTSLAVHTGANDRLKGRFEGVEPDGALRLRVEDGGIEIVRAGDVEL